MSGREIPGGASEMTSSVIGHALPVPYHGEITYELEEQQARDLCAELIEIRGISDEPENISIYRIGGTSKFANLGRNLERRIFERSFANDSSTMAEEYGPYDGIDGELQKSDFYVALDTDKLVVAGVLRNINPSSSGIKIINDLNRGHTESGHPLTLTEDPTKIVEFDMEALRRVHGIEYIEDCIEIGTIAIERGYRNPAGLVSRGLHRACLQGVLKSGRRHAVSVVDEAYANLSLVGVPYIPLAETPSIDYLGSKARAYYCDIAKVVPGMTAVAEQLAHNKESGTPDEQAFANYVAPIVDGILHGTDTDHMMRFDFDEALTLV
jgi:hypothetical protein